MDGVTKEIEVKNPKKAEKAEPKPRTCMIEQALPSSVVQLVKAAPHNDTVRSVMLAHLKQPVPDELKTFEDIKEWIETTIVIKALKHVSSPLSVDGRVQIRIEGYDKEHGRAAYSVNRKGEGNYRLGLQTFLNHVANADDLDELIQRLSDTIGDDWDSNINMDWVDGTIHYDDHETDDEDGFTETGWDYQDGHREAIMQLIRQYAPEHVERLQDE